MKKQLIGLLDLDGTLVKSESLKEESHRETILSFGAKLPDDFVFPIGSSRKVVVEALIDASGLKVNFEDYCTKYQSFYDPKRTKIQAMPHIIEMLDMFIDTGIRLCLITTSNRKDMQAALDATNLNKYFEYKISGDDVKNKKPDPEPYLMGIDLMNAQKEECFILEDTESGVKAGVAAVIKTFGFDRGHGHSLKECGVISIFTGNSMPEDILKSIQSSFTE